MSEVNEKVCEEFIKIGFDAGKRYTYAKLLEWLERKGKFGWMADLKTWREETKILSLKDSVEDTDISVLIDKKESKVPYKANYEYKEPPTKIPAEPPQPAVPPKK